MAAVMAARQAARYGAIAKQSGANPKVRAEAQMAMLSLAVAARRAQEIGIADAAADKRVMAQLGQAQRHTAKAVRIARRPRRRARVFRAIVVLVGAGVVGSAAYGKWKPRATPQQPTDLPAQRTADLASPTTADPLLPEAGDGRQVESA